MTKEQKEDWLIIGITVIMWLALLLFYNPTTNAQNVIRQGNVFVQQQTVGDSVQTAYYYQDVNGNTYPIFLSSKGKAYCWVKSKNGKMYKNIFQK